MIIGKQTDIRYFTGFEGDYGFLAVGNGPSTFFTSSLYAEEARQNLGDKLQVTVPEKSLYDDMFALGKDFWGDRVGFNPGTVTCEHYTKMKASFSACELIAEKDITETLRAVKTPDEIALIQKAQLIAETVLTSILPDLNEGVEEREIANEIDYRFRKEGGEKSSFETIVAFGANSSKPHARPGITKLAHNDIVLFDMGTVVGGYASDMTRSYVFGKADSATKAIYSAVLDAQEAAIDGIHDGILSKHADALARDIITERGYGAEFVHTLGHGVGLDIHEFPALSKKSDTVLSKGMVVTVEPGIYIAGTGGIRIEDMLVIETAGVKNLTSMPKKLTEL